MSSDIINHEVTEPNSKLVLYSILVTAILLAIMIVVGFIFFKSELSISQNRKQDNANRHPYIVNIEKEAIKNLSSLKWMNKSKGQVQIPIELAKHVVIKNYN